jgi:hypothetical protein
MTMSNPCRFLAIVAAGLLAAGQAHALTSFSLTLTPSTSWDAPTFTFVNTSTAGEQITDLSIQIGDASYHFDTVGPADASESLTGATLLSPDRINNNWWQIGGRSDVLAWSFADFDAGETLIFTGEMDLDLSFGNTVDARRVLFNNDFPFGDPNATVTAAFSDGSVASLTLPDGPSAGSYFFTSGPGTGGSSSVPEPSGFALLGVGLMGLVWMGAPRRRAAA